MQSERVRAILSGASAAKPDVEQTNPTTIQETITVPYEIGIWKSSLEYQPRARVVQTENRKRFEEAFARGLAVMDFSTDAKGNGIFELGQWQEPVSPNQRD
jgi:hypothetical protein